MTSEMRNAYRFFQQHAGGVVGFAAVGAWNLAKAEAEASDRGWECTWEFDDDADLSFMSPEERAEDHEVLGCVLRDENGEILESIWNVVDADRNYGRVIEAELALEALSALKAECDAIWDPQEGICPKCHGDHS